MKILSAAAAAAVALSATSAMAWEGQVKKCFDKVYVGPTYTTTKKLVKHAKEQYEHRADGTIALVHYAPVYREYRHLATPGHYVMKEISCGCPVCD